MKDTTDRVTLRHFNRFHEILTECDRLQQNLSIQNMRTLAQQLELLSHLWRECLPELKLTTNIDTKDLENWMSNINGGYGAMSMNSFASALEMTKRMADKISKQPN